MVRDYNFSALYLLQLSGLKLSAILYEPPNKRTNTL